MSSLQLPGAAPPSLETLHLAMDPAWPLAPQAADGDGTELPSDEQQALPSQLLPEQVRQHVMINYLAKPLLNVLRLPP
jgi:hypothetical protein